MSGFHAPPESEFDSLAGLLDAQRGHLGQLGNYAGTTCANTDGLAHALSFLQQPVVDLSTFMNNKYFDCQGGIGKVATDVRDTGHEYAKSDARAESFVRASYPAPLGAFQEISGGPSVGSYNDIDIELPEPDDAEDILKANLDHVLSALGTIEHIWRWVTGGDSLLERLVTPIMGNYGRLQYLSQAYASLSDATYTVAGNLRRGTYKMAPQWNGEAATAFEFLMFRWHMGIGGLGDLDKVASQVLHDGYLTVAALVQAVLDAIGAFINHEGKKLVEAAAGTAAIEAVGGGPEDPVADVVAVGWDAWKIYQAVSIAITAINEIIKLIGKLIDGVKELGQEIDEIKELISDAAEDPGQAAKDALDQGLNRAGEIEKDQFWNPKLGAARIAMLPSS